MDTTRLSRSDHSQSVRLQIDDPWQGLAAGLAAFEPGFQLARLQPSQAARADLDAARPAVPGAASP